MTELDVLDPAEEHVKLSTGAVLVLESLRTRQFFKLLRILTHGAGSVLGDLFRINPNESAEDFAAKLASMLVLSIPDAEDETIAFLHSMCKPVGLIERRPLNKQDTERNNELWRVLDRELNNPELDDLVTIIETIVRRESADIQALGKRLGAMFNLAQKTGQLSSSHSPTSTTSTSSADSADPSTSSPPSTDGPTSTSVNSPSDGSASVSPPSGNDASTSDGSSDSG